MRLRIAPPSLVGACRLRQSKPSIVSSSVKVVCQTSPWTAFKCRYKAKYLPLGADGRSAAPVGLDEIPDVLSRSSDRSAGDDAGPKEPLATLASGGCSWGRSPCSCS